MKFNKKISVLLLMILACVMFVCLGACQSSGGGEQSAQDSDSQSTGVVVTLVMSSARLTLDEDESYRLTVSKSDDSAVGAVVWSSSNENVATVSEGTVTAIVGGTAIITAAADGLTATCEVTVVESDEYPVLELSRYNAVILEGDETTVDASATYKGNSVNITSVTATSGNNDVATVSVRGTTVIITAIAYGETIVGISSYYKNKPMTRSVSVKVNEDVQMTLDENAELYTFTFGEFLSEKQLNASVFLKGTVLESPQIEWSVDDDEVLTVLNGTITAVGIGEATVTAKYVAASGVEYTKNCIVTVSKTSADLGTSIELYLNPADGSNVFTLIGDLGAPAFEDYAMSYVATGEAIKLTAVEGGYTADIVAGCHKVRLTSASANAEFTAEMTVITKVIRTLEELDNLAAYGEFTENTEDPEKLTFTLKAFFVLGANIDATGHSFEKYRSYFYADDDSAGLVGGFDGKGYTIYGGTYYMSGLFGQVAKGSIVRNLALSNVTLGLEQAGGAIAQRNYGTIDNCLVEVVDFDKSYCAMSAICDRNYGLISNCVTSFPLIGTNNDQSRAICEFNYADDADIINCYAITDDTPVFNVFTGKIDIKTFEYGTKASEITFTGLSAYFNLSGDKIAFASLADLMVEIEEKKEAVAKAFIGDVNEQTIALYNGNEATLIETIEYTAYKLIGLNEEYAEFVTIENGKVMISEAADESFTFGIKYYYTKDEAIAKTVTYEVFFTKIINRTFDLFVAQNMTFDIAELGLVAGENYALSRVDGTAVAIDVSDTEITVSGLAAGEYVVVFEEDGNKYQFVLAVITAKISSYEEFCSVRDANTTDGTWNGYYILAKDIVMPSDLYASGVSTFSGTFDGRGHTVYGGHFHSAGDPSCSLFGNLSGTVKNTAFTGCVLGIFGGIAYEVSGVIDNCLIECTRLDANVYNDQAPFYHITSAGTVSNTIIYVAGGNGSNNDKGAFTMLGGTLNNVYVFSTKVVGYDYRTNQTGETLYSYNTSLSNANVIGLNDYFDLSGDKATFGFDYDVWYSEYVEETVALLEIENLSLQNGDKIELPVLPFGVNWSIQYEDASFNGSVTIRDNKLYVKAVKVGAFNFTLTATYSANAEVTKSFCFSVEYTVIIDDTVYLVDGKQMNVDLVQDLGVTVGNSYALKEGDTNIIFSINGNVITLNSLAFGEHNLTLIIDGTVIRFQVVVCTEVITTIDQLVTFASPVSTDPFTPRHNNGYYVLGANIDADGYTFNNINGSFSGTFDGRGYVISNGTFSSQSSGDTEPGGLFGTINTGAVIKNLAITNATLATLLDYNWMKTSVFTGSGYNCGTIKDCYIQISAKGSAPAYGISGHMNGGSLENVIINISVELNYNVCEMVLGSSTLTNVYVIGGGASDNGWVGGTLTGAATHVSSLSKDQQAAFNDEVWGFENGVPYFKKAVPTT